MKLYVYCIVDDLDTYDAETHGIAGATVRLLKIDELAVLVSDSAAEAVQVTPENALAHAAVARSILDRTTPLPFRFGTLITEQQLRSYVSTRKSALQTQLAHVRGCVEMSVKIIWELPKQDEPKQQHQLSGTAFLAEKRRQIAGDECRIAQATELSTWLHEKVKGLTRDEQVTTRASEKLVLSAAHLVERDKFADYREKLAGARAERPDLHFLLSGPWPPYSFANIELEFKSQFGVS